MYVARHTFSPTYDVERNWSAWIDGAWDTREQALRSLAEDDTLFYELQDRYPELDDDEIIQHVIDRQQYDVRYNKEYAKWQHVHHDGLSCYRLEAETVSEAIAEARERVNIFDWYGFGETTVGTVRHVAQITETLHVFECEDTWTESQF